MAKWVWFDRKGRDIKVTVGQQTFDVDSEGRLSPAPTEDTSERLRAHPRFRCVSDKSAPSPPPAPSASPDAPPLKPQAVANPQPKSSLKKRIASKKKKKKER